MEILGTGAIAPIHDDLDASVFDAYGWPHDLNDDEILRRLVDLNRERAEEEKRGIIRWLRPEYQNPEGTQAARATQGALPIEPEATEVTAATAGAALLAQDTTRASAGCARRPCRPADRPDSRATGPALSSRNTRRVTDMLNTLVSLGQARALEGGRYLPT